MRNLRIPFLRRFLKDEKGQTAAVVLMVMFGLLAMSAAGIETGHVYYAVRLLQASTNASALAAAQAMPNIGTGTGSCTSNGQTVNNAWCDVYLYSSSSGDGVTGLNTTNLLTGGSVTATFTCNSTVASDLSVACQTPTSGSCSNSATTCNQVTVTQKATVPLWFGGLVGMSSMHLSATANAAMRGGTNVQYNIAMIIDTTESMATCEQSGGGNPCTKDCPNGATSEVACAIQGLQVMLGKMDPCALNQTCTNSGATAVDSVSLFVFPAIETSVSSSGTVTDYASDDTTCPTSNPPIVPYGWVDLASNSSSSSNILSEPFVTSTTSSPNTYLNGTTKIGGTYEVTSWDIGYRSSDTSTTLNTSDPLTIAAGGSSSGNCKGLQAPGGEHTYYAEAIQAAQAALVAEQTKYPGSQNVMIIMSDGDAQSCNSQAYTGDDGDAACTNGSQMVALNCPAVTSSVVNGKTVVSCTSTTIALGGGTTLYCPGGTSSSNPGTCTGIPLNGTGTSTTNPNGYNIATYPSALGECGQAVWAAQQATAAGTMVYTVAMGSEVTSDNNDCQTDQMVTLTGSSTLGAVAWPSAFESGVAARSPCNAIGAMASSPNTFYSDNVNGCAATNNAAFTTMAQIFTALSNNLTAARLVPPGS
jgi:Flp pilus assembly protein TadG